jgi:hypothetical protein
MNSGSPVVSRYVQPAATAARTAGRPHLTNGPTVETSTSAPSAAAKTVFARIASARTTSRPPRRDAKASNRDSERPASTGRTPAAASRSAISPPV